MRILLMALIVAGFSSQAFAQARGYLGVQAGLSVPDADNTSSRLAFGASGGARLDGEFGIGAYYLSSSKEEENNGNKFDFNYQFYGFEGSFHFEGVADGAYVGIRAGISKVEVGSTEFSPTNYGVLFGYDHFISEVWSAGLEGSYMKVESDTANNIKLDSFNTIQLMASTKVWF